MQLLSVMIMTSAPSSIMASFKIWGDLAPELQSVDAYESDAPKAGPPFVVPDSEPPK